MREFRPGHCPRNTPPGLQTRGRHAQRCILTHAHSRADARHANAGLPAIDEIQEGNMEQRHLTLGKIRGGE